MTLLERISHAWLILSAVSFIIAGIVLFLIMNYILAGDLDENLSSGENRVVRIIRDEGVLPYQPPFTEVTEISVNSGIYKRIHDTTIYDPFDRESKGFRELLSTVSIDGRYYKIIIREVLVEKSDLLGAVFLSSATIFLLLLAGLYFINKKLAQKYWMPFYKTLEEVKDFTTDKEDFILSGKTDITEFRELNDSIEKLTKRIIDDYRSLKRFTEDASHEIQTPIAIIQSKLESMIQDPDLKKDQADKIQSALAASGRLSRLTRSLLLLSKIENRQYSDRYEFDLSAIIEMQIESLKELIAQKNAVIEIKKENPCFINANRFLTESLVLNLIGNALKHGKENNKIEILLNKDSFSISNYGNPLNIPAEKLFDRFYKQNSLSESFGLGLSIVKTICEVNNWAIRYFNEDSIHRITVCFNSPKMEPAK